MKPLIPTLVSTLAFSVGVITHQGVLARSASHDEITFTLLADTTGPLNAPISAPSLNNQDQAAFASARDGGGVALVFADGDATPEILVKIPESGMTSISSMPCIDDHGEIAIQAHFTGSDEALCMHDAYSTVVIADNTGMFASFGNTPSMNNHGIMVFRARLANGGDGVFRINLNSGALNPVVTAGGNIADFSAAQPCINKRGDVAFQCGLTNGASAICVSHGHRLLKIADTTGPLDSLNIGGIDDHGDVVFFATRDDGAEGIFRGDGGSLLTIADTDQGFLGFAGEPSINGGGDVAYTAFSGNDTAIYLYRGPNQPPLKVIQTGDALDGSIVRGLSLSRWALNDHEHLAFSAILEDGREGAYRADPPRQTGHSAARR